MSGNLTKGKHVVIDLEGYPDLVVIYLGMRVNSLRGLRTLISVVPQIKASVAGRPDGLLRHETIGWGLFPPHIGMRQYWRDFESLEDWSRTGIHAEWWRSFVRDRKGTGFWHETYFARGGFEAIYIDVPHKIGMMAFAPHVAKRGSMFSARRRLRISGDESRPSPIPEADYGAYIVDPESAATVQ
ncbi:MAG TPA: DUF4188 domain-containing protein [Candidatus Dormibacteraeota bacterium]|nr:DUF4188 domain-containing protein [Candidatus Dormibacteraeota bacterium]